MLVGAIIGIFLWVPCGFGCGCDMGPMWENQVYILHNHIDFDLKHTETTKCCVKLFKYFLFSNE